MTSERQLDMHEQVNGTEPDVEEMHEVVYREKTEPFEGGQPVPAEMIVAAFALLLFGGWYLGTYSADFAVDRYEGPAAFQGGPSEQMQSSEEIDPMLMGKRVFNNCASCHQADGQGVQGRYPPLDGNPVVSDREDNLARIVLHGLIGPVEVAGKHYNDRMPKWSHLDDGSLAAVLTYIRASWSNEAPPVSDELVAKVRAATSGRTTAWTVAELQSAPRIEVKAGVEPESDQVQDMAPEEKPTE